MEWQQIEYFQVVASMQHMSRAAEVLSISQPALSRSISRLEEELGVSLFERQNRSIVLNRYGKLFLNHTTKIIQELKEAKQEIQDVLDPEHGLISLGFLHTLGTHRIPELIGAFRKQHPDVKFQLNQNNSKLIIDQLEAGEIDLGFTTYRESNLDLNWVELWSEELFAIVPKVHHLAEHSSIKLSQIADEQFISYKQGYVLRMITEQLCKESGFIPKILFEGEEVATIAGLVAAGLGVAIVPQSKKLDSDQIAVISIESPKCERVIKMAWAEGRYLSPSVKLFKDFIIDYFKPEK